MASIKRPTAALGLRVHSGWAALVAVVGDRRSINVVDRRKVELANAVTFGPKQPYHEAEGKPLAAARRIIERFSEDARRRALEDLRAVTTQLQAKGERISGCGVLQASDKPLPNLESILASHALIHAADGELFRAAVAGAAEKCGLVLLRVRERDLFDRATKVIQISEEELRDRITELGRALGPPWTRDQKLAAIAAWLTVAET